MTDSNRYARSFPAVTGDVVTQGHANHCAEHGHATHTVDGVVSPFCPRCGESNPAAPAAADLTLSHLSYNPATRGWFGCDCAIGVDHNVSRSHFATDEELALIVADQRSGGFFDDEESDEDVLEYVWDTMTLPGHSAMGAEDVVLDGTPTADAYLAFLTTRGAGVEAGAMHLDTPTGIPLCWTNRELGGDFVTFWTASHLAAVDCPVCSRLVSFASTL